MAKSAGMGDRFAYAGYDLSGDIGSLGSIHGGPALLEITAINKLAYERTGGKRDGGIDFSSWFNPAAGAEHKILSTLPTASQYAMYGRGALIGSQVACLYGKQIMYDPTRGEDGSLALASSVQADGFGLEWGEQLTPWTRTDATATNGTALDFGAVSTTFGGQAYLQVFAFTGTSVTVKLQDSADNATFADVTGAGFVAATALGAQRIAFTGTVRRYVRVATTGTFTNAQFAVGFVRNLTAVIF